MINYLNDIESCMIKFDVYNGTVSNNEIKSIE